MGTGTAFHGGFGCKLEWDCFGVTWREIIFGVFFGPTMSTDHTLWIGCRVVHLHSLEVVAIGVSRRRFVGKNLLSFVDI